MDKFGGKILLYKASAGSGKTFLLVYEYIKFLFAGQACFFKYSRDWCPNIHRTILAVTFTNKATAEMKSRIVEALYDLANVNNSLYVSWFKRDLPDIVDDSNECRIQLVALRLLSDLLNDYTAFRIQTIDGFFQQVVRAFAIEFNLSSDYAIELDSKSIIERAVDDMLSDLGDNENADLLKWLTDFVDERIADGDSWNPRADILKMAANIGTEKYQTIGRSDFNYTLNSCADKLKKIKRDFEIELKVICDEVAECLCKIGLEESEYKAHSLSGFKYEKIIGSKFLFTDTFLKCAQDKCFFSKVKLKQISNAIDISDKLAYFANKIIELCDVKTEKFIKYKTACIILGNFYVTGILSKIECYLNSICNREDIMVLSSISELINKIIDGSDTPFIYERVGTFTNHFMIDEFQDTSVLQWSNFRPLISESVSRGYDSMIVGDVKQSIYRWRNGDWSILHEKVNDDFGFVDDKKLNINYRSEYEIVNFNNFIYAELAKYLTEHIEGFPSVYDSVVQELPDDKIINKKGYVRCNIFECTSKSQGLEMSLDGMIDTLSTLTSYQGVAILGRTNKQLVDIANKLMEKKIPFCSSESLRVADNAAVKFIVSVLYFFAKPYETLYALNMVAKYKLLFCEETISANEHELLSKVSLSRHSFRTQEVIDNEIWLKDLFREQFEIIFKNNFGEHSLDDFVRVFLDLRFLSLESCVDNIISLFCLYNIRDNGSYFQFIRCFVDQIHDFLCAKKGDLVDFLNFWEIKSSSLYVPMPDSLNSVVVCTIHKSKGLEFDTVFIPFVNFDMGISSSSDIRFAEFPNEMLVDGNRLPFVAIDMRSHKNLLKSYFKDKIYDEYINACLDELNALYVATTRAKKNLYLNLIKVNNSSKKKVKDENLKVISIADVLGEIIAKYGNKVRVNDESILYEFGEVYLRQDKRDFESDLESGDLFDMDFARPNPIVINERMSLKFSSQNDEFASFGSIQFGLLMHRLFEKIKQRNDVGLVLKREYDNGVFDDEMYQMLKVFFNNDDLDSILFPVGFDVVNEVEIWSARLKKIYRPDRVLCNYQTNEAIVVDYKFGERTDNNEKVYKRQISNYLILLKEMGFSVKGFLCYVMSNEIINV